MSQPNGQAATAVNGHEPLLRASGVTVRYGAFRAVSDMSLVVEPGQIVGLIGPNGAGKSTMINALSGAVIPRAGTIEFGGQPTRGLRMDQLSRAGLVRTFQNLEVFGSMTVLENVLVRLEATAAARSLSRTARLDKCRAVLRELGLRNPDIEVSSLAYPQRKLVEFARAMVADARLLLLDEPTAGLAAEERQRVVDLVTSQMRGRGISGVLVEHDMNVVRRMCDVVYVMDAGSCIAQGTFGEISGDPRVREAYLGTDAAET